MVQGLERTKGFTIVLWVALLAAVALEISGFRTSHIFRQEVWIPQGLRRFLWYGLVFAGLGVGFSFGRRYFVPVILGAVVVGTWIAVGPVALGAALLFVFSATVLGRLVFGAELDGAVAFLGGAAIWILFLSCLIRVPIQYAAVYLILLALPLGAGFADRSAVGVGLGAIVSAGVDSDGGGIRRDRFGGVRGWGALAGGAEAGGQL